MHMCVHACVCVLVCAQEIEVWPAQEMQVWPLLGTMIMAAAVGM